MDASSKIPKAEARLGGLRLRTDGISVVVVAPEGAEAVLKNVHLVVPHIPHALLADGAIIQLQRPTLGDLVQSSRLRAAISPKFIKQLFCKKISIETYNRSTAKRYPARERENVKR
jgi:hypothetical protein